MYRSVALLTVIVSMLAVAAPAGAQAPPPEIGTWVGSYRDDGARIGMRVVIRQLQIGKRAGRTSYRGPSGTCRGRITLRQRTARGFVLRDRLVSGPRNDCTSGDTLVVRVVNGRLRVRVRNGGSVLRVTLRRA